MSNIKNRRLVTTGIVAGLGLAIIPALAIVLGSSSNTFAISVDGNVRLNTEVSSSLAMKIASPNDTNPDCTPESGVTYGTANRYASSTGDNSGKVVDTFDGREGEKDEVNTNTSCATLSMSPNTYDSTYSDVTVYTNSGTGYALSVRSADNTSPNLVNTVDSTLTIPAGTLTEQDGTGEQAGRKIVPGGQNKWAYKTDNGIITNWTAATTTDTAIKAYDQVTSGGETTRVTYGISAGNNPAGRYATTLTYTATMFDSFNSYVSKLDIVAGDENIALSSNKLSIPFGKSATVTATPAEGYYLSSITCPEGFTCSGYDISVDNTEPQTITVTNQNTNNTGTVSIAAQEATPVCNANVAVGRTCYNSAADDTLMVKLADGHFWTKESRGNSTQAGAASLCPSGTILPSFNIFKTLILVYGGSPNGYTDGYSDYDGDIYDVTGWVGDFWSSSHVSWSADAYMAMQVTTSGAGTYGPYSSTVLSVVCYR